MHRARVGFSKGSSVMAKVICRVTGSPVSHSFLVFDVGGKEMVLDVAFPSTRLVSMEEFQKTDTVIAVIEPVRPIELNLEELMEWVNRGYDLGGFFGIGIMLLTKRFRLFRRNPLASRLKYTCASSIVALLKKVGYPGADQLDGGRIHPHELMEFFQKK